MFFWIVIFLVFLLFLFLQVLFLVSFYKKEKNKKEELIKKRKKIKEEEDRLKKKLIDLEEEMNKYFFFYDLTRKIAPILDKEELLNTFLEELKKQKGIEDIKFEGKEKDYFKFYFYLGKESPLFWSVKTKSKKVLEYFSHYTELLKLCLERIDLYVKLQQLSIYDSLTGIYNRRYFMERYMEESARAEKFNLHLSFLMVDIDHFKKINDIYGHLVGDIVLKEIAKILKENIREIDFVARFGGEEFSIILPETDKAGAIMVGERIRSKVVTQKFRAFDEILTTSISVGVASYPQNTLYSDVLIEIADKALYKAKVEGRNRVCWF
jgi:diguanylate cyclase (GGDEF)-like protein